MPFPISESDRVYYYVYVWATVPCSNHHNSSCDHQCWYVCTQENELYYLGRSLRSNCPEEPSYRKEGPQGAVNADEDDEDRIYDVVSHSSDIMTDNEILVNICSSV